MANLPHTGSSDSSPQHEPDPDLDGADHSDHSDHIGTADQLLALTGEEDLMKDLMDERLNRMPMRRLRGLINQTFKDLDAPHPPFGTQHRYDTLLDVVEERARHSTDVHVRESFRDNTLHRRFELRIDGTLAAHMKYKIHAGRIALTDGVEHPEFRDQGVDATLLRHVLLNTHKRRLSVVPQCPMVFAFLTDNPQYQALAASDTAPSVHLNS